MKETELEHRLGEIEHKLLFLETQMILFNKRINNIYQCVEGMKYNKKTVE